MDQVLWEWWSHSITVKFQISLESQNASTYFAVGRLRTSRRVISVYNGHDHDLYFSVSSVLSINSIKILIEFFANSRIAEA